MDSTLTATFPSPLSLRATPLSGGDSDQRHGGEIYSVSPQNRYSSSETGRTGIDSESECWRDFDLQLPTCHTGWL